MREKLQQPILRVNSILSKVNWMELIYLALFGGYVISAYLGTTTMDYELPYDFGPVIYNCLLGYIVANMAFGKKLTKVQASMIGIGFTVLLCSNLLNSEPAITHLFLFCIGARNISFKKIAAVYLIIATQIQIFAMAFSILGISVNFVYSMERGMRHSFGICYPTDFTAHILFIILVYCYLRWKKITYVEILMIFPISIVMYKYTLARNNVLCLLVLGVFLLGYKILNHFHIDLRRSRIIPLLPYVMPLCALLILVLSLLYNESGVMQTINNVLSNRPFMGNVGLKEHGVSIFGSVFSESGFGFGNVFKEGQEYFFLDSSYLRILVKYGLVVFAMVLTAYVVISRKLIKHNMEYGLIFIMIIAFSSFMEHHLLELAFNPFTLLLFSNIGDQTDLMRKKGQKGGQGNEKTLA